MKNKFKSLSLISILFVSLVCSFAINNLKDWENEKKIIEWDARIYYSYLPATFIYQDLSLNFVDENKDFKKLFWSNKAPNGNKVIKSSMGLAYLYSPFFFLGHLWATVNSNFDASGFSLPYRLLLHLSSLFYAILGMIFLRKIMLKYFNEIVSSLVIIATVLGSNLFHFIVTKSTMSHSYSFFLIAWFVWLTIKWYEERNFKLSIGIGLLAGLISLIRPTNIIVVLFFVMWGLASISDFKERFELFVKNYRHILLMIIGGILVWIPQMIYWKIQTGSWFYYSYNENEGFFFNNPQIFEVLFGFRKGWIIYSPIMIFALVGIPLLFKKFKESAISISFFFLLNTYIISSWWCWWYGGSLGMRPYIDSYAITAIPMGVFFNYILSKKRWIKLVFAGVFIYFTYLGIFFMYKWRSGSIHMDSMTQSAYFHSFFSKVPKQGFRDLLEKPDYKMAEKGIYVSDKKETE